VGVTRDSVHPKGSIHPHWLCILCFKGCVIWVLTVHSVEVSINIVCGYFIVVCQFIALSVPYTKFRDVNIGLLAKLVIGCVKPVLYRLLFLLAFLRKYYYIKQITLCFICCNVRITGIGNHIIHCSSVFSALQIKLIYPCEPRSSNRLYTKEMCGIFVIVMQLSLGTMIKKNKFDYH